MIPGTAGPGKGVRPWVRHRRTEPDQLPSDGQLPTVGAAPAERVGGAQSIGTPPPHAGNNQPLEYHIWSTSRGFVGIHIRRFTQTDQHPAHRDSAVQAGRQTGTGLRHRRPGLGQCRLGRSGAAEYGDAVGPAAAGGQFGA